MNFDFYIFGTPVVKYNQFIFASNSKVFKKFALNQQSDKQLIIYREGQLIYYTYLRYGLLSKTRNEGAYLGMSMVFNIVCFYDITGIFELFDNLFLSMVSKGEIIKQDKTGKIIFAIDKFIDKQAAIEECRVALQRCFVNQFNQINSDYTILDSSFNQTNLTVKTLSLSDKNSDIIYAVRNFRHIVLTSQNFSVLKPVNYSKWVKWVISLLAVSIAIYSIFWVIRNGYNQTPAVVSNYEVDLLDGSTYQYTGEIKDKMPNGQGNAKYIDGNIYDGEFENGLRQGKGTMVFADGYTYTGDYDQKKAIGQGEIHYSIPGKYLCNIESPKKERLKIIISVNSITNKFYGQFTNYGYRETLSSEFVINGMSDNTQITNAILGEGSIIKNSNGEIEIISTLKNEKKWNMRKIK